MMKRIVALNGGLGNQMFQYAFARALEIEKKCQTEFDTGFYEIVPDRSVVLDKYCIVDRSFRDHRVYNVIRRVTQRIPFICWLVGTYKEYAQFQLDPRVFKYNYRFYFGYWQNRGYFQKYRDLLKCELKYKDEEIFSESGIAKELAGDNSIAVHVRRGDYINGDHKVSYHCLSEGYYRKAIERATSLICNGGIEQTRLYFFSNDIKWCENRFCDLTNATFVDVSMSPSEHTDMLLMKRARGLVMANSTFSWWAAWLSERGDKIVIAPENWYCDDKMNDKAIKALLDERWIVENDK